MPEPKTVFIDDVEYLPGAQVIRVSREDYLNWKSRGEAYRVAYDRETKVIGVAFGIVVLFLFVVPSWIGDSLPVEIRALIGTLFLLAYTIILFWTSGRTRMVKKAMINTQDRILKRARLKNVDRDHVSLGGDKNAEASRYVLLPRFEAATVDGEQ